MEQRHALALIKEEERFQALFEYASLGILVANEKGEIQLVNHFLLTQFEYEDKNDLIGKQVEMLIPRRFESVHHKHRENYSKKPEPRSMGVGRDLFAVKKSGKEFPVEVSLSNYQTSEGNFIIAFVIDITKRKETENAIILQREQLAEKNLKIEELNLDLEKKVDLRTTQLKDAMHQVEKSHEEIKAALNKEKELGDLKSRFVSMASHEFRTPLSTILSSASLLAKYTEENQQEQRDKHINRIKSSVNNLTGILNEFLSIGKIEDGKVSVNPVSFNLREFISAIASEMKAIAKESQQFQTAHKGEEVIFSDDSLLRNIIFNLVSNAIKFTGDKGLISITSEVDNDAFSITVSDNGIGISPQDQQHLFERFFRASNAMNIQGTGLGLHIIAKYAELLNGTVDFKSELNKGSSFTVTFQQIKR